MPCGTMATITVTISPGAPIHAEAKHGDAVVFLLSGYSADTRATITFPDAASASACFTDPGPFELRPYSLAPPQRIVSPHATQGLHRFEVSIETRPVLNGRQLPHPLTGSKNGGIDVTSHPLGGIRG